MLRRGFLFGAGATLAVVRTPGLLMPVRPVRPARAIVVDLLAMSDTPDWQQLTEELRTALAPFVRQRFDLAQDAMLKAAGAVIDRYMPTQCYTLVELEREAQSSVMVRLDVNLDWESA